mmetsp:Transcript_54674/g.166134  ORF Transcript_54674/g.166134 Transcript_54674/m.166134 type:complete len:257 (+) Transcript_54674:727-1497(+)
MATSGSCHWDVALKSFASECPPGWACRVREGARYLRSQRSRCGVDLTHEHDLLRPNVRYCFAVPRLLAARLQPAARLLREVVPERRAQAPLRGGSGARQTEGDGQARRGAARSLQSDPQGAAAGGGLADLAQVVAHAVHLDDGVSDAHRAVRVRQVPILHEPRADPRDAPGLARLRLQVDTQLCGTCLVQRDDVGVASAMVREVAVALQADLNAAAGALESAGSPGLLAARGWRDNEFHRHGANARQVNCNAGGNH